MFAENEVTSPARSFLLRVGPDGWSAMTLEQQLAVRGHDRRLVAWLIVTGRVRPTADYLVASKLRVGKVAAGIYREFHGRFIADRGRAGVRPQVGGAAVVGGREGRGARRRVAGAADQGTARHRPRATDRRDPPAAPRPSNASPAGDDAAARRRGDVVPRRRDRRRRRASATGTSPQLVHSSGRRSRRGYARRSQGYIEQMRLSLRPATMVRVEAVLREFAGWLTTHAPEVAAVARSAPRSHRELQAPPRRAAVGPRQRAALEHRAGRAARHAARVPRSTERMGR